MKQSIKDFIREGDTYDAYGNVMGNWFGIATTLQVEGEPIPDEWQYRPGACEPSLETFEDEEYHRMLKNGEVTASDLREAGNVLHRWANMLDTAGRSY